MLTKQKTDMENTLSMFEDIKGVCGELGEVSRQTLVSADEIFYGTEQQKQSVADIMECLLEIVGQ